MPHQPWAISPLQQALLRWYQHQGRDLPWRHSRDAYAIWVSEIMLQQTQVQTVIPYYQRWLEHFPTISSLAAADQDQVLKQWQGLGYYARARNLHHAARIVEADHGGKFPEQFEQVIALPGIGRTTAGGILSAAFNQPWPILDGNVKRVLARLLALDRPPKQAEAYLWQWSEQLLPHGQARDFNQALMDLGATRCTPRQPLCHDCPWQAHCRAYAENKHHQIPIKMKTNPIPHKYIGVAVIWNDAGQLLIDRRPAAGLLGGLWEFPGGKIEPGETVQDCIVREVTEELGIAVDVGEHLIDIDHAYSHFKVTLQVYHCRHRQGEPQPLGCDAVRWVSLEELDQYAFPKANEQIIAALRSQAHPIDLPPTDLPV
ncbi:A/G-specific adenine glycosylase [Candidatus Synechococcus calcipolaris G9]|uniref:Adenine DNA glycosylase n=1 Tax=Candidatus Synechococcus calcipolaris G9 TaxID=1497997 RepID=A0ABT6EX44_9SYNE|nr:A/G-specific adenine glycosylase [Candidatus Synechococcus calcipolaris]MDG2990341.1 A/G-specific adenine glycosylase [Candidatus Synechococcus calcipolaris G9]